MTRCVQLISILLLPTLWMAGCVFESTLDSKTQCRSSTDCPTGEACFQDGSEEGRCRQSSAIANRDTGVDTSNDGGVLGLDQGNTSDATRDSETTNPDTTPPGPDVPPGCPPDSCVPVGSRICVAGGANQERNIVADCVEDADGCGVAQALFHCSNPRRCVDGVCQEN